MRLSRKVVGGLPSFGVGGLICREVWVDPVGVETRTIYVGLVGEGVDVWRPVEATVEPGGAFRLPREAPAGEVWEFAPGSRVRCDRRAPSEGRALVATQLVG